MRTATEKYNAVLEGRFTKNEFVRQMRLEFPQFITQWNGFEDSVQILRNKGMIFESNHQSNDRGIEALADKFPLEAIDRGVDVELAVMGIDPTGSVTKEAYLQAKKKVISNLQKNPNHYLDLIAKESPSVDKNDKMKETKRGAKDIDAKNQLKNATLKENMHDEPTSKLKENLSVVVDYLKKEKAADNEVIKDFIRTHAKDIQGMSLDQIGDEYDEYYSVNYEHPSDFMEQEDSPKTEDYKPGNMWSDNFDYDGMLYAGLAIRLDTPVETMQAISDSFEDVNYHRENDHLQATIEALKSSDMAGAKTHLKQFRAEVKKTLGTFKEGAEKNRKPLAELEDASAVVMQEKKGKDQDGDGDVDDKDYMAAKDKAIKKAMDKKVNEAVKSIVVKVLEEQMINEAATAELARLADDYAGFQGMKPAIVDLQNIVTDIEAYYDKTRDKIQKIFDTLGEIRNEEGLKVGGFIAPAIESAFNKDLRPATRLGFTSGLDKPKVRVLSQADIDAHNSGERPLGETPEQPKQSVFTPNF